MAVTMNASMLVRDTRAPGPGIEPTAGPSHSKLTTAASLRARQRAGAGYAEYVAIARPGEPLDPCRTSLAALCYCNRLRALSRGEGALIRSPELLEQLDRRYARERLAKRTYPEALAIFEALWREARELNPGFPGDWKDDIRPDLNVARALNGLPPIP